MSDSWEDRQGLAMGVVGGTREQCSGFPTLLRGPTAHWHFSHWKSCSSEFTCLSASTIYSVLSVMLEQMWERIPLTIHLCMLLPPYFHVCSSHHTSTHTSPIMHPCMCFVSFTHASTLQASSQPPYVHLSFLLFMQHLLSLHPCSCHIPPPLTRPLISETQQHRTALLSQKCQGPFCFHPIILPMLPRKMMLSSVH